MILDRLSREGKLSVHTTQPLIIYYKDQNSHSECWDKSRNKWLDVNDIDDSYELDIMDQSDTISVMIPRGAKCILRKTTPNADCTVEYNNIETDLLFEDEPIESFFEIIEE